MRDHTDILNRAVEGVEPERAATVEEFQRGQLSFRDKFLASIYNPAQAQTAAFAEMIAAPVEAVGQVGTMLGASEDNLLRRGAEGFRSLFDYDERMVVGGRPVVDPGLGSEFASGLGSAAGFIGGGAAAKLIGAGSKLTSAGLGAVTQAQSMYREAEAAGATDAQKFGAFALGGAVGTSEAIGIGSLLARLDKRSGGTLGSQLQRVVKFSGREAAEEAGQEAFQQFSQDIIAQQILKYAEPEDVEQLIANAAKGGLIGGMVGGFLGGAGVLGQDAAIEGAIKQEATEGARGVLGTIQQAEKEEVKERKTPEQAVEVLKRKNKVEDASWEIVTEESADEEQADFLATVTQMREAGGSLPDIVLVDGGQELPNQGVYTGGVIVIDAQRAADAKSAILLHEMVHHSMPVGSEAFKAAAAQAQQQFPLLAARMASIYDAMYTRQNGSRAYATVQDEAMRAALLFEEAMALGAEMMPKAVGEILSKPDALSDEALLADRTTLQAIRDWIVAAANKILRTSKFKGTRAKRLEESLAALEAERVLDIADGDADAVKAMLEALRGVYTQASPKEWGSAAESEVPGVPIQFQLPAAPETPLLEDPQAARRRRRPQEAEESRRRLRGEDVDPGQPAGRVETPGDAAAQESAIPLPEREGQVEVAGRRRPGRRVGERRAEGEPEAAPTPGVTAASEEQVAAEVSTAATEAGEPVAEAPESQQVEAAPEGLSAEEREVYDYLVSEGMAPDEALAELRDMVEEDASFDKSEFGERDKQRRKDGVEPDRFSVASGGMFDPRAAAREQTYTSERTSLNQIPASFKGVDWKPGTINFDIGGGAYDEGSEYLSGRGVTNLIYDPFNRSRLFNMKNVARAKGGVDTVTVANVLNVIAERGMRNRVLREAAAFLKPGGEVYIQIHEGDKDGNSRKTPKGWQEHRRIDTYVSEVEEVFGSVEKSRISYITDKGNKTSLEVLIAKSPLEAQDADEAALLMQAEQAVGMKRHPEYGVGKLIGGDLYVEKSHMDRLPQKVQRIARRLAEQMPDYDYKVVKWNEREGTVSFIQSPDFDTAQEPLVTASVKHTPGKGFGKQTKHSNVYHHKWLFVAPDYAGFDVGESYQRTLDVVDMIERGDKKPSQLGTKKAWDEFTGGASRFSVAAPLDSPEFRRWFGNSKVVDAQGRPMVVSHWTKQPFHQYIRDYAEGKPRSRFDAERAMLHAMPLAEAEGVLDALRDGKESLESVLARVPEAFNPRLSGSTDSGWWGRGSYFADQGTFHAGLGGHEYRVYLSLQNPYIVGESPKPDGLPNPRFKPREFTEALEAAGYDGVIARGEHSTMSGGSEYVAFRPEQIKSATGNVGAYGQRPVTEAEAAPLGMTAAEANEAQARGDIRFSVAGDLAALHNLSEENILHADEIGGLAMPSLMVRKVEHGPYEGFGDITLIAGPEAVDPEQGVPVFESDAWTPRHPRVQHRKSERKAQAVVNELKPHLEAAGVNTWDAYDNLLANNIGWSKDRDVAEGWIKGRSSRWPLIYELSQGRPVRRYRKGQKVELLGAESAAFRDWLTANAGNRFGDLQVGSDLHQSLTDALVEGADEQFSGMDGWSGLREEFPEAFREDGLIKYRLSHIDQMRRAASAPEIDYDRMADIARKRMDRGAFESWVDGLLDRVWTAPYVEVGRRKVPYSLDAVVEAMATQRPEGQEKSMTFGAGKARAVVAERFGSLEDIRAAKDRLVDDFAAYESEVQGPLQEAYHAAVVPSYKWRDSFDALDDSMRALAKSMKRGAPTHTKVRRALRSMDFVSPSEEAVDLGVKLAEAIRLAPSEYFEAKYPGAMRLDAFRGALIPSRAKRAAEVLERHGVPVTTYTPGQDRGKRLESALRKAKRKSGEDARFSVAAFHGSPHDIRDGFSTDKIGTGEGNQAYGWGLYFGEDQGMVRRYYKERLSGGRDAFRLMVGGSEVRVMDRDFDRYVLGAMQRRKEWASSLDSASEAEGVDVVEAARDLLPRAEKELARYGPGVRDGLPESKKPVFDRGLARASELVGQYRQIIEAGADAIEIADPGYGYTVRLAPADDEWLLWDRPLSEQSEKVKAAMMPGGAISAMLYPRLQPGRRQYERMSQADRDSIGTAGKARDDYNRLAEHLGSQRAASLALLDAGIRGIKYLDGTSRSKGEGSFNYVVFDDADVEITDRWSVAGDAAVMSEQRVDRAISLTERMGLQGWIAVVDPGDFFAATLPAENREEFERYVGPLDVDRLSGEPETPYLVVTEDAGAPSGWRVDDHEGRHRMVALRNAGVTQAQIWVEVRDPRGGSVGWLPSLTLEGQGKDLEREFADVDAAAGLDPMVVNVSPVLLTNLIPATRENRQAILEQSRALGGSIRYSVAAPDAEGFEGIAYGELTRLEKARRQMQDYFYAPRKAQAAVKEKRGGELPQEQDVDLAETLFSGRAGARLETFEAEATSELNEILGDDLTLDDAHDFAYAAHAPERNAWVMSQYPDGGWGTEVKPGSGMRTSEAKALVKGKLEGEHGARYRRLNRFLRRMARQELRTLDEAGLLTEGFKAAIEAQGYKYYVPLIHTMKNRPTILQGRGFNVKGSGIKRAKGRTSAPDNVVLNLLAKNQQAIVRAEKARVDRALYELVKENPDPSLWTVMDVPVRIEDDGSGVLKQLWDVRIDKQDQTVFATIDGEVKAIVFNERGADLARALNKTGVDGAHAILRKSRKVLRYLAAINTSWNPEFVVTNFLRDAQTAGIVVGAEGKGGVRAVLKGALPAIREIHRHERGAETSEWWQRMKDAGGKTGWYHAKSLDEIQQDLSKSIRRMQRRGGERGMNTGHAIAEAVENANLAVENGVRLSAFKWAVENGASDAQAAEFAKNLTVNFNRQGEAQWLSSLYMFANASIQGSTRILTTLAKSKYGKRVAAGLVLGGLLSDMLNYLASPDDEDGENAWDAHPEWAKDRYFMLPDGNGGFFSVPMPYGFNFFQTLGRKMGEMARYALGEGGSKPTQAGADILSSAIGAFSPIGDFHSADWQSGLRFASPTVLDPMVELATNRDWRNAPIRPEGSPFDRVDPPAHTVAWDSTNGLWKSSAGLLNWMTGGDEFTEGAVSVSPEDLQYLTEFSLGGVLRFGNRMVNAFGQIPDAPVQAISDMPWIRQLHRTESERKGWTTFREHAVEIEWAQNAYDVLDERGDKEGAAEVEDEFGWLLKLSEDLKRIDRHRKRQRRKIDAAEGEAQDALTDELYADIREFNRKVNEARQ